MSSEPESPSEVRKTNLVNLAESKSPGLIREFWDFIAHNKKWWMLPVLAVLLMLGAFVMFSGSAAATLIYTLF
jgi:hypothetical protein